MKPFAGRRGVHLLISLAMLWRVCSPVLSVPVENPPWILESSPWNRLAELAETAETAGALRSGPSSPSPSAGAALHSSSEPSSTLSAEPVSAAIVPFTDYSTIGLVPVHDLDGSTLEGVPRFQHPTMFRLMPPSNFDSLKIVKGTPAYRNLVLEKFKIDFRRSHNFDPDVLWIDDARRLFDQELGFHYQGVWDSPRHMRIITQFRRKKFIGIRRQLEDSSYIVNDYVLYFRRIESEVRAVNLARRQYYVVALPLTETDPSRHGKRVSHASIEIGVLDAPSGRL